MKIGDKVKVRNRLTQLIQRHSVGRKSRQWLPFSEPTPVYGGAIYLGKVTLYNGDSVWENEEVGWVFDRTGQVNAVVVQPLDAGGRYRRPVYALPEDVEVTA